jgi:hypothetical protein
MTRWRRPTLTADELSTLESSYRPHELIGYS